MVQVPVVYGEWVMRDCKWYFELDHPKGCRLFFLNDASTHCELTEMAREEFNLVNTEMVELTYMLPDSMTQMMDKDSTTPPIHVVNDRQVRGLVELSKTQCVRLCVSSLMGKTSEPKEEVADEEAELGGNCDVKVEDWSDEGGEEFEDVDTDLSNDEGVSEVEADDPPLDESVVIDAYLKDYSVYGKVKHDDDSENDDDKPNLGEEGSYVGEGQRPKVGWSDGISLDACFPTKEKLITELHVTAIMAQFAFKVFKSTKRLFVAVCRVPGCHWRVRAMVKNEPTAFFVTVYRQHHTCTASDRLQLRKRYAPRYIAKLFWSEWKTIDGVTPAMMRSVLHGKFGLTMNYSTSYRALIFAQEMVMGTPEA